MTYAPPDPDVVARAQRILEELLGPKDPLRTGKGPQAVYLGRYPNRGALARAMQTRFGGTEGAHKRAIERVVAGECGESKLDQLETFLRSHGPSHKPEYSMALGANPIPCVSPEGLQSV